MSDEQAKEITWVALDRYLDRRYEVHEYFGYKEDWVAIPIDDRREYWWGLDGEGPGRVGYSTTKSSVLRGLFDGDLVFDYFEDVIYTQCYLPRWVYRGLDFTMICVDTNVDGNRFLAIYSNAKEVRREGT